jgi:hypothetical protein
MKNLSIDWYWGDPKYWSIGYKREPHWSDVGLFHEIAIGPLFITWESE